MKSILPETITISLHDAYDSTKQSLGKFNTYMESDDLRKLINEMESSDFFDMWKEALNKALNEAEELKTQ